VRPPGTERAAVTQDARVGRPESGSKKGSFHRSGPNHDDRAIAVNDQRMAG
jgi:hypothetical protein